MYQYEAVIKVIQDNGGYATLGYLYQHVLDVPGVTWKTKTPYASIRRIVQDRDEIFKIKPGLWALESYRDRLPPQILPKEETDEAEIELYNHAYYQGLLIEIGNLEKHTTFVPAQDKNQLYLQKRLGEIAKTTDCPLFTYDRVIRRARTIDVIWFNERGFPARLYEVEHSTNVQNSLLKFVELQDFHAEFFIVADSVREDLFRDKISQSAFQPIVERVRFLDYDRLSGWHESVHKLSDFEI
jgi:hypothetical protein